MRPASNPKHAVPRSTLARVPKPMLTIDRVNTLPGNDSPQLPTCGDLFGLRVIALVNGMAVYESLNPVPVRYKHPRTQHITLH